MQLMKHACEGFILVWNLGQTLPEVQNRDINSPTKETGPPKYLKEKNVN